MTPEQFKQWRKGMKLTQAKAAEALGLGVSTVEAYDKGRWRDTGKAVEIPTPVALACSALSAGLKPWGDDGHRIGSVINMPHCNGT